MKHLLKTLSLSVALTLSVSTATIAESAAEYISNIGTQANLQGLERVKQILVAPPFMPKHDQKYTGKPRIIEIEMSVEEKEMEIAPGAFAQALTFNGSNPGPMIVVHEGDYVELTLKNPKSNIMVHNIDFHAATGALGGGALTKVAPGEQVVLRFKADRTGTFVYHCAPGGAMIPYHVVAGMNGAIMVLPRGGLTDQNAKPVTYDKAYYIGEQDWYLAKGEDGNYKRYSSPIMAMGDTMKVMSTLTPSHITYNGKAGALTGKGALTAKVGETVLFIHSQANRDTRTHLIGGHADLFWHGGSFADAPMTNRETWPIFGGEAVAALYTFKQPGIYVYVNHNLIEGVLLGAAAHVSVEGEWNNDLMEQVQAPTKIK